MRRFTFLLVIRGWNRLLSSHVSHPAAAPSHNEPALPPPPPPQGFASQTQSKSNVGPWLLPFAAVYAVVAALKVAQSLKK